MFHKKTAKRYTNEDNEYFAALLQNHTFTEAIDIIKEQEKYQDRSVMSIRSRLNYLIERQKPFTHDENNHLLELYDIYGKQWKKITEMVTRNWPPTVRTQINMLLKRREYLHDLVKHGQIQLPGNEIPDCQVTDAPIKYIDNPFPIYEDNPESSSSWEFANDDETKLPIEF